MYRTMTGAAVDLRAGETTSVALSEAARAVADVQDETVDADSARFDETALAAAAMVAAAAAVSAHWSMPRWSLRAAATVIVGKTATMECVIGIPDPAGRSRSRATRGIPVLERRIQLGHCRWRRGGNVPGPGGHRRCWRIRCPVACRGNAGLKPTVGRAFTNRP